MGHTGLERPLLAGKQSAVYTVDPWGYTDRSSEPSPEGLGLEQGWWEVEEAEW